ncbi:hypothetical protein B0T14DRAFT_340563 [Immersiella caudata]|uniref:Uncharacterized protein n=1 Tax=Immersiella caudata TaxID=314043 RepID=A0AA39TYT2_9PEZI|nr:hypothetical protein B0T14DRAFT_340563 [Immersiella caudata]
MSCSGGAWPDWMWWATLLRTSPSQCPEAPPRSKGAGFTPLRLGRKGAPSRLPSPGNQPFSRKLLARRVRCHDRLWRLALLSWSHEAEVQDTLVQGNDSRRLSFRWQTVGLSPTSTTDEG